MSLYLCDSAPYFYFICFQSGEVINVMSLLLELPFYLHILVLGLLIEVAFIVNDIFEYKSIFVYLYCNDTINIRV